MEIENAMLQMVEVPLGLIVGCFLVGGFSFWLLDGLSAILSFFVDKLRTKLKNDKEKKSNNV